MAYERLVGLYVTDEAAYAAYREQMTPLLHAVGGSFRYDFRVAEALQSEAEHPINRLFLISFPTRSLHDQFFQDPRYLEARRAHFERAVQGATVLAVLER